MVETIKDNLPNISWDKHKGIVVFLVLVFALLVYFTFFNTAPDSLKPQPTTYTSVSVPKQDTILKLTPLKTKPKLKPLGSSHKSESKIDVNKYHEDIIKSLTYNTMGTYDLPEEINKKLKAKIDSVIIKQMNAIVKSYKHYKINILASDTSGIIVFQKI